MDGLAGPDLRERVDEHLDRLIGRFYEEVPYARHFLEDQTINVSYLRRHNIETVLRIRRKRVIDAYAIRYFTHHDPPAAAAWCKYCEEEMLHDRMFMRDLKEMGVTPEEAYSHDPMLSTRLMMGYLWYGMEYEETPLALLVSVYLMEYVTVLTQPRWLDNVASSLGDEYVKGARAHVGTDIEEDHADFVWGVLSRLINTEADERKVFEHLDALYRLWAMYFTELHALTVGTSERDSVRELAALI